MSIPRELWLSLICVLGGLSAGCSHSASPPLETAPRPAITARPTQPIDIRRYLAANRAGNWVYQRRDLRAGGEAQYVRKADSSRLLEGNASWHIFQAIDRRLTGGQDDLRINPIAAGGSPPAHAFRFSVAEPLALIPDDLQPGTPSVARTRLDYLDLDGRPRGHGALTRTAVIQGREDVDVPAGHFADCLRVRVNLHLDMRWGPTIDWTTYVWLAPDVGEVRRLARLSGRLLFLSFGSSFEYELASRPANVSPPSGSPAPRWKEGFMAFDRGIPNPRLATLMVHFEDTAGSQFASTK
jgi:hypothetical protein